MSVVSREVKEISVGEKYIEFGLGKELYAVPLLSVREVISVPETTSIPNASSYFVGIMNLRGQVITVLDLRKKLNIKPDVDRKEEAVIIIHNQGLQVGLVVDAIIKVTEILSLDEVSIVPELSTQANAKYIKGVLKKEEKLTVLLNIDEVLDTKALQAIKKVA